MVIPYLQETYMGGWGDPMSSGNLDRCGGGGGGLISAGNLDGGSHICKKPRLGGDPIPTGSRMGNPISAGNLDGGEGGSHTCRKPR